MKVLYLAFPLILFALVANAQELQCVQSEFSGEASQGHQFSQELGQGLVLSVVPMRDSPWGWFLIKVIDKSRLYGFNMSDVNWLLATPDWGSSSIGALHSDQKAALEYRVRDLLIPLSFDDKEELRKIASALYMAKPPEEERNALAALKSMRLGQIKFEIDDYRFEEGEPPTSVDWVKFTAILTAPADFPLSEKLVSAKLSLRYVDCPAISDEVIANIRDPKRHEYFLATETATPAKP